MAHLSLANSHLIMGYLFEHDPRVNAILSDTNRHSVLLYPSRRSVNLTPLSEEELRNLVPQGKRLTVFVIDGTWSTAKKTVNQSPNLNSLPRICFTPPGPSNFRVRLQPRPECYSTIEAIHYTAELLGPAVGLDSTTREHDQLLFVFSKMVDRELQFAGARIGSTL
jgi:DTW domain-containing protein YfiP